MTDLQTAAQQALEAMEYTGLDVGKFNRINSACAALRAALAQEQAEPPTNQCGETCERAKLCAACARALEEPTGKQSLQVESVQEPVAKVELMMTGGNAGLATRIVEIDDHLRERLRPGQLLYTAPPRCPSCASLEAQNTELDRKLAELERADPAQEPVARECSDPMCACRGGPCAECEEGRREKEIEDLRFRLDFYQRRCEALQSWQSKMRDPERTIVCDILANGFTLDPAFAGDRYTAPPQRKPLTDEEIERHIGYRLPEYAMRLLLELVNERAHGIGGDDGQA